MSQQYTGDTATITTPAGDASTQKYEEARPGAASLTAAGVTIFMLTLAFYIGGYVAGRLARFDGGRQGFGVWMIAVLVGALAGGAGWVLDSQYGLVDKINRPDVAIADN